MFREWLYLRRSQKRLREAGVKMTMRKLKRILDEPHEPDLPIRYAPVLGSLDADTAEKAAKESAAIFRKLLMGPPQ